MEGRAEEVSTAATNYAYSPCSSLQEAVRAILKCVGFDFDPKTEDNTSSSSTSDQKQKQKHKEMVTKPSSHEDEKDSSSSSSSSSSNTGQQEDADPLPSSPADETASDPPEDDPMPPRSPISRGSGGQTN